MRKKRAEEHENLERWLLTYADLITLLLAFFIMLYTLSKNDAQKYHEIASHLKAIFSGGTGILEGGFLTEKGVLELPGYPEKEKELIKKMQDELGETLGKEAGQKTFSIVSDERGVVIRILDRAFFDEGKAELKENAKKTLDNIVPILKEIQNPIRIEGHTDNVPIRNVEFRSNWELSVRRATEVVRYLIEKHSLPPHRFSASGYSEYRPIAPNDTEEGRALNRRIEIVILKGEKI